MIIKYLGFLLTLLWSYTFIKSQSIFKKGSGILITLFVSNISWLTFFAACFYGFKNFSFYQTLLGIVVSITLVHLAFSRLSLYINSKFSDKRYLIMIKTTIEYLIIGIFASYIFFWLVKIVERVLKFLSMITISPDLGTTSVIAVIIT